MSATPLRQGDWYFLQVMNKTLANKAFIHTLSIYAAKYEQIWKWMVEFLYQFQGRGIKIDRDNSIRVAKPLIFFDILCVVARKVTSSWAIYFFVLSFHLPIRSLYT